MWRLSSIALLALLSSQGLRSQDGGPDDLWVSAYGWLQAGSRLAGAELWPLALGSYIESHRQIEALAERHPDFEPQVVSYRREQLEEQIAFARGNLEPGEQEIMRKYLDFIDSYEEGLRLRFENQYVESLNILDIAKVLLDEIIFEKPDEFRAAVESQYQLLHESIEWLDSQINFQQRSRPPVFVGDGGEWGTTEYVQVGDLPAEGDSVFVEDALFPGGVAHSSRSNVGMKERVSTERGDRPGGAADGVKNDGSGERGGGLPGFRMSSSQKTIPDLPEELRQDEVEHQQPQEEEE